MATPTLIVVAFVAVLTVVALGLTVLMLVGQLRRLVAGLVELRDRLEPAVGDLAQSAEVTRRELEAVADAADQVRSRR